MGWKIQPLSGRWTAELRRSLWRRGHHQGGSSSGDWEVEDTEEPGEGQNEGRWISLGWSGR